MKELRAFVGASAGWGRDLQLKVGYVPGGPQWNAILSVGPLTGMPRSARLTYQFLPNEIIYSCVLRDSSDRPSTLTMLQARLAPAAPSAAWYHDTLTDDAGKPVTSTSDIALLGAGFPGLLLTANDRTASMWYLATSGYRAGHLCDFPPTADPIVALGALASSIGSPLPELPMGGALEVFASCQPPRGDAYIMMCTSTGTPLGFSSWTKLAPHSKTIAQPPPISPSGPFAAFPSDYGTIGNYELLIPAGNQIKAYWRNNDDPTYPWTEMPAPDVPAGHTVIALSGMQSATEEVPPNGDFFIFAQLRLTAGPADGSADVLHEYRRYGLTWTNLGQIVATTAGSQL